jgi:hypothetical protein
MNDYCMIAKKNNVVLKVFPDFCPENPRTDWDNFGHMICWHNRYDLGDDHNYSEPRDLLVDLVRENNLCDKLIKNHISDFHIVEDTENETGFMIMYKDEKLGVEDTKEFAEQCLKDYLENEFLDYDIKKELLFDEIKKEIVILPLFLYDHSGITMNTTGFICPWDSGQVGWIYATKNDIIENYGEYTQNTIEKAKELLRCEVDVYDQYLRGDVYWFSLEEAITCECCGITHYESIDSCGGFYGSDMQSNGLKDYIPAEHMELVELLEWTRY